MRDYQVFNSAKPCESSKLLLFSQPWHCNNICDVGWLYHQHSCSPPTSDTRFEDMNILFEFKLTCKKQNSYRFIKQDPHCCKYLCCILSELPFILARYYKWSGRDTFITQFLSHRELNSLFIWYTLFVLMENERFHCSKKEKFWRSFVQSSW